MHYGSPRVLLSLEGDIESMSVVIFPVTLKIINFNFLINDLLSVL